MLKPCVLLLCANIIPPLTSSNKQNTPALILLACSFYGSESVTRTVNETVPSAVGVPEITPAGESVNPAGSTPELTDHS